MADRDPKTGRFIVGNRASPGRKPRRVETDLQQTLTERARQKWTAIVDAAINEAIAGNVAAMRFLAEYTIGKAPNVLELRTPEAALLRDLLREFEARGVQPSEVFEAMLQEIAEVEVDEP